MICKADVSEADFDMLNWPFQTRDEITQHLIWSHIWNIGVEMVIISPCSYENQRGKKAPLKRIDVLFSCYKKDTVDIISGGFILIKVL